MPAPRTPPSPPATRDRDAAIVRIVNKADRGTIDGNSRIHWLATIAFHGLNGIPREALKDDAYNLVIQIVSRDAPHHQPADHIGQDVVPIDTSSGLM